ncbi:MAG: glycosyltransferase [Sulfurimonas sp.]|nr:glycosyltransferase [Sulfurimonas sp.]MDD3834163.1 glycosyltransferase [Sulfurimonas sp.]
MKASIVIITYNRADFIEKALQSALSQDYEDLEIIVCDDCSTDNTQEVVHKYLDSKKIHYHKNKKNKGQLANYFFALKELTKGEWLFILSDDDFFENTNHVSKCMQFALKNDVDMILTNSKTYNTTITSSCHSDIHKHFDLKEYSPDTLVDTWKQFPEILDSACCFKKEIFFKGFGDSALATPEESMRICEDHDLLMMKNRVGYLYDISYVFTIGGHNLNKFKVDMYQFITMLKSFIKPLEYAANHNIFEMRELEAIYLKKWAYYKRCASFVGKYLGDEFDVFVKYVIANYNDKNIFDLIENKAREYSSKFQTSINLDINKFNNISHIYDNKKLKLDDVTTALIYGTKIMGIEAKKYLASLNIDVVGFIDDNPTSPQIDGVKVYDSSILKSLNADIYVIATGNYLYIQNMYNQLISSNISKDKIITI